MRWLKTTLNEIYGLFVDDVAFAASIVGWLISIAALLRLFPRSADWVGVLFAAGLLFVLVESATRYARGHRRGR